MAWVALAVSMAMALGYAFPVPREATRPAPTPPAAWASGFCEAALWFGEVDLDATKTVRFARRDTLAAAAEGGKWTGHLIVATARMNAAVRSLPHWPPGEDLRAALARLVRTAERLAGAAFYDPLQEGLVERPWRLYRQARSGLHRAAERLRSPITCP